MEIKELLTNSYFIGGVMAVLTFAITQLLKLPIKNFTKWLTAKYNLSQRATKIMNVSILFIPFAIGLGFEALYYTHYLHAAFTGLRGLSIGASSITLFNAIERFFKVKIPNPYTDTEEGKAVVKLVEDVTADGKIDHEDVDAVQEFLDKINK